MAPRQRPKALPKRDLLAASVKEEKIQKLRPRACHCLLGDPAEVRVQGPSPHPKAPAQRLVAQGAAHKRLEHPGLLRGERVLRTKTPNLFIKRTHLPPH